MSDNAGSNWVGPFVLGFLLGVLLCVGAGGMFVMNMQQRVLEEARRAEMERERAMHSEMNARVQQQRAEEELKKLKGGEKKE